MSVGVYEAMNRYEEAQNVELPWHKSMNSAMREVLAATCKAKGM
jgi:hypothetical protein